MRISLRLRDASLSLAAVLALCLPARAQAPTGSLADLSSSVSPGTRIEVTRADGSLVVGVLRRISEAGVLLDVGELQVDVPAAGVGEISRRGDSLKNGVIIGGLVGTAVAIWLGSTMESDVEGPASAIPLFSVVGGAGAGALFDAMSGRTTVIFRAAPASRIAVVPTFSRDRKGLALHLRF